MQWKAKEPRNSLFRARKVPLENKMGVAPSGWMAEVGFALQRGIADAEAAVVAGERISQAAEWAYSAVRDGSSITCSSAEFSVVCAAEFAAVRRAVRVADAEFYADLGLPSGAGRTNLQCISKAMASGQSSAFFFISANYRFLIKTLCKADYASITRALPAYLRYMEEAHAAGRTTLLPLYLGAWSLRLGGGRPMRFIALNNFFAGQHVIYRRFDLKGSTHGRRASSAEVAKGRFAVYKDLDFRREQRQLHLGAQRAPRLRRVHLLLRVRRSDRGVEFVLVSLEARDHLRVRLLLPPLLLSQLLPLPLDLLALVERCVRDGGEPRHLGAHRLLAPLRRAHLEDDVAPLDPQHVDHVRELRVRLLHLRCAALEHLHPVEECVALHDRRVARRRAHQREPPLAAGVRRLLLLERLHLRSQLGDLVADKLSLEHQVAELVAVDVPRALVRFALPRGEPRVRPELWLAAAEAGRCRPDGRRREPPRARAVVVAVAVAAVAIAAAAAAETRRARRPCGEPRARRVAAAASPRRRRRRLQLRALRQRAARRPPPHALDNLLLPPRRLVKLAPRLQHARQVRARDVRRRRRGVADAPRRRLPLLRGGRHRAGVDLGQRDGVAAVDRL